MVVRERGAGPLLYPSLAVSFGKQTPLSEPFEPFEGVVDKDPVLVVGVAVLVTAVHRRRRVGRNLEVDIGEVVEVRCVVDGLE